MCPKKKSEEKDYLTIHLILTELGKTLAGDDSSTTTIKTRFQISILDADGKPGKQAGGLYMVYMYLFDIHFPCYSLREINLVLFLFVNRKFNHACFGF